MVKKKVRKVIQYLEEKLRQDNVHIAKIILFGSHATGRPGEESDIDLVIVSDDFRKKNIFRRIELIKTAEIQTIKKFMVPLDIITMTPEEYENKTSLSAQYAREGEIVSAG